MAVEQLLHKNINIRDFHPVKERPKSAREKFGELKNSPFYNTERELWNFNADPGGFATEPQLIGILVDKMFGTGNAQKKYEALKQDGFYNKELGGWNSFSSRSLDRFSREFSLYSEQNLLSILIENIFNKEKAKENYEKLKHTLYDEQDGLWNHFMDAAKYVVESRTSKSQLLGLLAEELFDPGKARAKYEELKQTPLYDNKLEQWNQSMYKNTDNIDPTCYSSDQLIGILIEGQYIDKEKAKRRYNVLKESPLYDKKLGWCKWIGSSEYPSESQLLGILVEAMLEEPEFTEKPMALPEIRKF
jgi:hypothetical protein